jgi:hypothetical protein
VLCVDHEATKPPNNIRCLGIDLHYM